MADVIVGAKKYSQEEVERAIAALQRTREQSKKWRERAQTPEAKAKASLAGTRRRIEQSLLLAKAKKQGITISKAELDAALAAAAKVKK
jgi:hypothetical protein